MSDGLIAPGLIDRRSIVDVLPEDLDGFTQCNFFAGIGGWSYALRLAGWPDDRPVWTGSCPCPSFSAAGKGKGFDDPRHLWPEFFRLIRECRPSVVFGEQVEAAIGHGWLDLVSADLQGEGYAVGAAVLGACSVGAPHQRKRLYFCAHTEGMGRGVRYADDKRSSDGEIDASANDCETESRSNSNGRFPGDGDLQRSGEQRLFEEDSETGKRGNVTSSRQQTRLTEFIGTESGSERTSSGSIFGDGRDSSQRGLPMHGSAPGDAGHLALANEPGIGSYADLPSAPRLGDDSGTRENSERLRDGSGSASSELRAWRGPGWLDPLTARSVAEAGATRGFWADCDWWHARDGKYRPIGQGISPLVAGAAQRSLLALADGISGGVGLVRDPGDEKIEGVEENEPETTEARVMRLRGYGNAIVALVAEAFIRSYMDVRGIVPAY